jgi:hypothetical protein
VFRSRIILVAALSLLVFASEANQVTGKFIVGGVDAKLRYARAETAKLDEKGKMGYAILMTAKPATNPIQDWRTGEPSRTGSFIFLMVEKNGDVWIAELGHDKAKSGRFGVVTEMNKVSFSVTGNRLKGHYKTDGQQFFTQDYYDVDVTFDVTLEK